VTHDNRTTCETGVVLVVADRLTAERRGANMRRIRSKDTLPELVVRRFLHRAGLRYRLHARDLPGKPDLVFSARRVCVFVHGCFWHGCTRCIDGTRQVKSNTEYWSPKIEGNRARDERHRRVLRKSGWKVLTVWECECSNPARLRRLATSDYLLLAGGGEELAAAEGSSVLSARANASIAIFQVPFSRLRILNHLP
jgi:DNA mismatch endonuclease, patch repair protein